MLAYWMKAPRRLASDSGIALAVVLLILVIILMLGSILIGLSVTENQAGSRVADAKRAFLGAETGVQEAMYRMRLDATMLPNEANTACSATADPVVIGQQGTSTTSWADPTSPSFWKYNPPTCSWSYTAGGGYGGGIPGNFLGGAAGNLDSAGRTFTSSGSVHAAGGLLANATLANGASYTATVAPVVGYVGGCWQYVDQSGTPLGSCTAVAPNPMFKVISTGTVGSSVKTVSTMIRRFNVKPPLDGALTANSSVNVQSSSSGVIDGHNFDCNGNNPSDTGSVNAVTAPSDKTVSAKSPNLQCTAGSGDKCKGISPSFPSTLGALLLGSGAKQEDIDALNAYLESKKITPSQAPTSAFDDLVYINDNYTKPPDGSKGIVIVHSTSNNATLGNFDTGTFDGLIIADQLSITGGKTIGGIITLGTGATVTLSDVAATPYIKYSKCQIDKLYRYFPYQVVRGTWHE